jgi:hypothetical protein
LCPFTNECSSLLASSDTLTCAAFGPGISHSLSCDFDACHFITST